MTQQWLSIVEYARAYRMSDMTVRRRIKTGKLHAVLKEGKYFIPVDMNEGNGGSSSRHAAPAPTPAPAPAVHYPSGHGGALPQMKVQAQPQYQPQPMPRRQAQEAPMPKHSAAHKTYPQVPPHHEGRGASSSLADLPPVNMHDYDDVGTDPASIPVSLRRPLTSQDTSLVDTRALLAFCDASLKKVTENERRTVEKFKSKLEALEATLAGRDQEIRTLRQKVEDLQLLITFIERKA